MNEADNLLKFVKGEKPPQGLRLNGGKKQQILRSFKDEVTDQYVIYGKITKGGCCVAAAGQCIIIGTFDELSNQTSVGCNDIVTLMAGYLTKSEWPTDPSQLGGNSSTWKPYIENMLIGKGNVDQALILSKDDGTVFSSSSSDFKLCTYEADIAQEDGTDSRETVDEIANVVQASLLFTNYDCCTFGIMYELVCVANEGSSQADPGTSHNGEKVPSKFTLEKLC